LIFSCKLVVFSETHHHYCNACAFELNRREGRSKFAHLSKKDWLTCDGSVLKAEQLGLVVTRDCGVRVHVAWQVWQAFGQIRGLHVLF